MECNSRSGFGNQDQQPKFRAGVCFGMKHLITQPVWLSIALALSTSATAVAGDPRGNPYQEIVTRNVFGLHPPQPRPEPPPAPLPRVKVVGITTMLGDKRALLKIYLPPSPPQPAKELSCILMIGQREGPIEVLGIDEVARTVKVNNSGTVMSVSLGSENPEPQAPSRGWSSSAFAAAGSGHRYAGIGVPGSGRILFRTR